jgi:hypothetical protein
MSLSFLFALTMQYYVADHIDLAMWRINCDPHHPAEPSGSKWSLQGLTPVQTEFYVACKGSGAVYRISFVTAVFFLLMMIGTRVDPRFHWGRWGPKTALYVGLILVSFFLPNDLFDGIGFAWISRGVSLLFLFVQIIMLIDFAHSWNEAWVANADAEPFEGKKWLHGLLASCVTLYTGSLVGMGILFHSYVLPGCSLSYFFVVMTFLGVISLTAVQLSGDEGALLPSAVVSAYAVYLCWAALVSNPHPECNPELDTLSGSTDPSQSFVHIVVGVGLAVFSLMWTTLSTADAAPDLMRTAGSGGGSGVVGQLDSGEKELKEVLVSSKMDGDDEGGDGDGGDGGEPWVFHLIMFSGSLYMAMLLTDWGTVTAAAENAATGDGLSNVNNITGGAASMWVKVLSQWAAIGLYVWTLLAPVLMPDYEFGQ